MWFLFRKVPSSCLGDAVYFIVTPLGLSYNFCKNCYNKKTFRVELRSWSRSAILFTHYENTPMQYTVIFHSGKNDNFRLKIFDYFHIFAQNIDSGYVRTICVLSKDKKIMYTPVNPNFTI